MKQANIKNYYIEKRKKENIRKYAINKAKEAKKTNNKMEIAFSNCFCRYPKFKGSKDDFKDAIEKQFLEKMTWDNYGEWEIDHIIPLSNNGVHCIENMQPLWKHDNRTKSNK